LALFVPTKIPNMKKLIAIIGLMAVLVSCKEDEAAPEFALDGIVLNVTERGVKNAEVKIYPEGENDPIQEVDTDDDGEFSVNLPAGDYEIEIEADGYNVFSDDFSIDEEDEVEFTLEGDAIVSGQIINSQTGYGLGEATVSFSFDPNAESSEESDLVVTTDGSGYFAIEGAPVGDFIQIIESDGFFTRIVENVEFTEGTNEVADQTLVDQPEPGSVRIILTWGSSPSDLDSHLTGPLAAGGRFHMHFAAQEPTNSSVSLDVDDTYSYGPETTTITTLRTGSYRYSVHNYSNQGATGASGIASSPAVVEIYNSEGMVNSFTAPAAGTGNTWRVFDLVVNGSTATVSPINSYVTVSSYSDNTNFRSGEKRAKFDMIDF
jgi:hypothetical protein